MERVVSTRYWWGSREDLVPLRSPSQSEQALRGAAFFSIDAPCPKKSFRDYRLSVSCTMSVFVLQMGLPRGKGIKYPRESARQSLCRKAQRKVRAP